MKFSFAYLDGEFDARDRIEFEAHLAMCGRCRDAVELDASFRSTVRKHLATQAVDPAVRARVQQRLTTARRQARLSRTLTVPMALAASITLAVISYQGLSQSVEQATQPQLVVTAATHNASAADETKVTTPSKRVATAGAPSAMPAVNRQVARSASSQARLRSEPGGSGNARLVHSEQPIAAGALAGVRGHARPQDWPMQRVRSAAGLRAMVKMHASPLPHEVEGNTAKIQSYLAARMSEVGAPPIVEGTGVRLRGARFSQLAGYPVVAYRYSAFGKPLTALRFLENKGDEPFDDAQERGASAGLEGTLDDHLAGYTVLHVLRGGNRYALVSELGLEPLQALLDLP